MDVSWSLKKAECRRTDASESVAENSFDSPLDSKEIQPVHPKENQSWIFIGRIDTEAETSILFGHLMQRTDSFVKTLMLGKIEGWRRRGWQRMRWLDGITHSMDMSLSKLRVLTAVHGVAKSRARLSDWTELTECYSFSFSKHWNMYITIGKAETSLWKQKSL